MSEAYQESVIVPSLQDVIIIGEGGREVSLRCHLYGFGVQLSRADGIPIIPLLGLGLLVVASAGLGGVFGLVDVNWGE